jgi:hypothetical protein
VTRGHYGKSGSGDKMDSTGKCGYLIGIIGNPSKMFCIFHDEMAASSAA